MMQMERGEQLLQCSLVSDGGDDEGTRETVEGRTGHQHVYRIQLLDRSDLYGDDWCDTMLAYLFFFPSSSPHGVYRLHTRGFVHKPVADGKRTHDCIAGGNTLRSRHFFLLGLRSNRFRSLSFSFTLFEWEPRSQKDRLTDKDTASTHSPSQPVV